MPGRTGLTLPMPRDVPTLSCALLPADAASAQDASCLLRVEFRAAAPAVGAATVVPGPVALGDPWCELWRSSAPVERGGEGGVVWAHDGHHALLAAHWPAGRGAGLALATARVYRHVLGTMRRLGYRWPLRIWNHLSAINDGWGDAERYKQFCLGRAWALSAAGLGESAYPAASAVGHEGEGNTLYLLAGRTPGRHIENPRQLSAYRYPRQYGPRQPAFARATLVGPLMFVSGTASIVGHRSRALNDLAGQLAVTRENLARLCEITARHGPRPRPVLLKAYVRRGEDGPAVAAFLEAAFPGVPSVCLRADICRRELLVEIEGVWVR